jgi:hypothetical protein
VSVTVPTPDYLVKVQCFNSAGSPSNTRFSLDLVLGAPDCDFCAQPASVGSAAYVYVSNATTAIGNKYAAGGYNSATKVNKVERTGPGAYTVHIGGFGGIAGGHVQVSVNGNSAAYCGFQSWAVGTPNTVKDVRVICRNAAGAPANQTFTLLYTKNAGLNMLGDNDYECVNNDQCGAYVWSDLPNTSTTPYTPGPASINWRSWSGGSTKVQHKGLGWYRVTFAPLAGNRGSAQVTPVAGTATCLISGIATSGSPHSVDVKCFKPSGGAVNAQFMLAYSR